MTLVAYSGWRCLACGACQQGEVPRACCPGYVLLRVLVDNPGIDVAWICDRDEERLARFAARYPSVQATTEFQTMLDDDELDAVVIATPVFSHVELCTRSLIAGKHTFVEKPLATSSALADQLIELAAVKGQALMCGHHL